MPGSDKEVFLELVSSSDHTDVSNFLTYAIFAFDRANWIVWHTQTTGSEPDQAAINAWTGNLTPHSFEVMRNRAQDFFDLAARDYLAADMEDAREDALRGGLLEEIRNAVQVQTAGLKETLAEVKSAGSFWKQLGLQTLTSIIAPLLIGSVIGIFLTFGDKLPSIRDIAGRISPAPASAPAEK